MANRLPQPINKGNAEFARRVRSFFGLMAEIARQADVTKSHVSYVLSGQRASETVMRIARRALELAERGKFRRAA
jgi:hypothetical protein